MSNTKRRFSEYSRRAILAAQQFNKPETAAPDQALIAQDLSDRLGYDMDFTFSSQAQARLATIAMLERKEIQQHGRIIKCQLGGK